MGNDDDDDISGFDPLQLFKKKKRTIRNPRWLNVNFDRFGMKWSKYAHIKRKTYLFD